MTDKDVDEIKSGVLTAQHDEICADLGWGMEQCQTCKWSDKHYGDIPCDYCLNGQSYFVPKDAISLAKVLEIIDKRIKWCEKNYALGEFIPDVYVLTLVEQEVNALADNSNTHNALDALDTKEDKTE